MLVGYVSWVIDYLWLIPFAVFGWDLSQNINKHKRRKSRDLGLGAYRMPERNEVRGSIVPVEQEMNEKPVIREELWFDFLHFAHSLALSVCYSM